MTDYCCPRSKNSQGRLSKNAFGADTARKLAPRKHTYILLEKWANDLLKYGVKVA
jgi:hypothetical protein